MEEKREYKKAVFRPEWIEAEAMAELGYEQTNDEGGYLEYVNKAGYVCESYGPMGKAKRQININTNILFREGQNPNYFYMGVRDDWNTRNSFNGVVKTKEFLIELLTCVR